jgi:phosphate-selective porin
LRCVVVTTLACTSAGAVARAQSTEDASADVAPIETDRALESTPPEPDAPPSTIPPPPLTASAALPTVDVGWGRGVTLRSDDGCYTLTIRGQMQALAELDLNHSHSASATSDDEYDPTVDLMIRRLRLVLSGTVLSRSLAYYIQLGFAPRDMDPDLLIPLRQAYLSFTELRDFSIRIGQMRVPFNRESVISSAWLQLVDRSISSTEFGLDRDQGIQFYSNDLFGLGGILGYQIGVFGGEGALRVNVHNPGLLYVARLQIQPLGPFEDSYSEVDMTREQRPRLSIGLGTAYNHLATRDRSTSSSVPGQFFETGTFDYGHLEIDAIFAYGGFSIQAEALVRQAVGVSARTGMRTLADGSSTTFVERARTGMGWMVQAGYLFSTEIPIELAARWSEVRPLGPPDGAGGIVTTVTPAREIVVGVNWYPIGHDLKVQFDYSLLSSSTDLDDATMRQSAHRFRLQLQAFF